MSWYQLSLVTNEATAPAIADFLSEIGAVSVTFMDAEDQPVYEPPLNAVKIWTDTKVIALFEMDAHLAIVKALIMEKFTDHPIHDWQEEVLQDQVWERTWLEHFQPMLFGKRLWICPSGMEKSEPNTVCMTLDPGLAFGTGTHPTTALCLEWLANQDLTGKTVIDFGCGSGILAIAAVLLGASLVHAIDIDPQALTATEMNAQKNGIPNKIKSYLPEQFTNETADIVLANILAKPLIDLNQSIGALVNAEGMLVLSGILIEQASSVTDAYTDRFTIAAPITQDDWCRLDGVKFR